MTVVKDYPSWLSVLKGVELEPFGDNNLHLKNLELYPTTDYFTQKQSIKFVLNNIGALRVNEKDGSLYHSFTLPRYADVIANIKSIDPEKVRVSVFMGGQRLQATTSKSVTHNHHDITKVNFFCFLLGSGSSPQSSTLHAKHSMI